MNRKEINHFKRKIFDQIEDLVQNLFDDPELILDLESGEENVCPVCEVLKKACKKYPNFRCSEAIKGNSMLSELEQALKRIQNGTYGYCISCNNPIAKQLLEENPVTLFCSGCNKK